MNARLSMIDSTFMRSSYYLNSLEFYQRPVTGYPKKVKKNNKNKKTVFVVLACKILH